MKNLEKLMAANLSKEEMLQLKAGAEEEIPDIDISPLTSNINYNRKCRCGDPTLPQNNYNYARRCKCYGRGDITNDANKCGQIITPTNPGICLANPASCFPPIEKVNLTC